MLRNPITSPVFLSCFQQIYSSLPAIHDKYMHSMLGTHVHTAALLLSNMMLRCHVCDNSHAAVIANYEIPGLLIKLILWWLAWLSILKWVKPDNGNTCLRFHYLEWEKWFVIKPGCESDCHWRGNRKWVGSLVRARAPETWRLLAVEVLEQEENQK